MNYVILKKTLRHHPSEWRRWSLAKDMEGDYEPFMNSLACTSVWVREREREKESLARRKGDTVFTLAGTTLK